MKRFLCLSFIFFSHTLYGISPLPDVNMSCPMKAFELISNPVKKINNESAKTKNNNDKGEILVPKPKKCQNTTVLHKYLKMQFPNIFTAELDSVKCTEHFLPFSNTFLSINQFFITKTIHVPLMYGL